MKKNKVLRIILLIFMGIITFETKVFAASTTQCNQLSDLKVDLSDLKVDLQNLFNFLKILLPLLIIGLSIMDFIKAITGDKDRELKKTFKRFVKRLVLAVVFFFLPVLINLLLDIFMIDSSVCIN